MRIRLGNSARARGFTAAELLISLIIAVMFIVSAQQLYIVVADNSGQVRMTAAANNVAYDTLRQYQDKATKPCLPFTSFDDNDPGTTDKPTPGFPIPTIPPEYDLSSGLVQVDITCPFSAGGMPDLSLVTVTVSYSNPKKVSLQHALVVGN